MKLPNGYGSIVKLSGNRRNPFRARVTCGWEINTDTGKVKQKYKTVGYYPTRKEALQGLSEYHKNPIGLINSSLTFYEVMERWFDETYPDSTVKLAKEYSTHMKLFESIYKMKFQDVKIDHLQKIVDESGKNKPTLKKTKALINNVYKYAVKHEIVPQSKADIMKMVDISNSSNPNQLNRRPFTPQEISILWQNSGSNEYVGIILALIYTGVRIGELLNLKKTDIHLEDRWFYVRQSKTKSGIREVPIAEKIVPIFEYWLNKNCEYLVCTPDLQPFKYRNYYDSYWTPVLETLGMEHTPHDTRHTCISLLTVAGVDARIIKQIVGHKGQGVTEEVYTHILLPYKLDAINKI